MAGSLILKKNVPQKQLFLKVKVTVTMHICVKVTFLD